jgi:hypothetical protein
MILVRTDHPCLRVGRHAHTLASRASASPTQQTPRCPTSRAPAPPTRPTPRYPTSHPYLFCPMPPRRWVALPPTPRATPPSMSTPTSSAQCLPTDAHVCILRAATGESPLPPPLPPMPCASPPLRVEWLIKTYGWVSKILRMTEQNPQND